jgi:hypothetical protein
VPLPTGQDVLTEVLRDGARPMLAQAMRTPSSRGAKGKTQLALEESRMRRGRCPAGSPAMTVVSVKTTARRNIDNYPIRFRYS